MTILRACVTCGIPSPGSYCSEHKPKPWATSKRRERMGLSGGAWDTVRRRVLERDMGCCYLCDELDPVGVTTVDHLIAVGDGGTSRMDNLASCHPDCHDHKHRDPEWARERVEMALSTLKRGAATTSAPVSRRPSRLAEPTRSPTPGGAE